MAEQATRASAKTEQKNVDLTIFIGSVPVSKRRSTTTERLYCIFPNAVKLKGIKPCVQKRTIFGFRYVNYGSSMVPEVNAENTFVETRLM